MPAQGVVSLLRFLSLGHSLPLYLPRLWAIDLCIKRVTRSYTENRSKVVIQASLFVLARLRRYC